MSKLARALALVATLAAMNLAGVTAVAQAHASDQATKRQVTSQQQPTGDAALRRLLARERSSIPNLPNGTPAQRLHQALGQVQAEPTSPVQPAEPSGQPGWLTPALGVLAAVLALAAGIAVAAARRANRSQRAGQAA
jgi:hypothetical protein